MDFSNTRPRREDIRARVLAGAQRGTVASLELAWDLGAVQAEGIYRNWTTDVGEHFRTLHEWVSYDLAQHLGTTRAIALAEVGVYLRGMREVIEQQVAAGKLGIARLMKLARLLARREVSAEEVAAALETGTVLPEEALGQITNDLNSRIRLVYPAGRGSEVRRGLTYLAVRYGVSSLEDVVARVAAAALADEELPPAVAPHRQRLEDGEYRCRLCFKIPVDPVEMPVGEAVLLCRTPCWEVIVKPEQPKYAKRWEKLAQLRHRQLRYEGRR